MTNAISHWELLVSSVPKAREFYTKVFDWKFDDTKPGYTLIATGSSMPGGMMTKPPMAPAPALHVYFQVDDIQRTLRAVAESGGTVIVPRSEIPGVGYFAMFLDPDRIAIGIFEPMKGTS
jgi:uncharacterized protein